MDLLQTLLVYMSLVFATSVQAAPEPSVIPETPDYLSAYTEVTPVPSPVPPPVPTINITPNPAYKTIQMGDRGDSVRELQERLREFGYYDGEIDGAYGNQTRQAVEKFQYMHGLTADGIAGRHTLTVLYESDEIRLPEGTTPTPEPTIAAQLSVAITPPPVEVSYVPVLTATPEAKPAHLPTAIPEPITAMPYSVVVSGENTGLEVYQQGETIYVPVLLLFREAGINVITSTSLELDEYAFAVGTQLVRFTHTENQSGEPVDLQVYRNDEPQLVPDRTLHLIDGALYMAVDNLNCLAGMTYTIDSEQQQIWITVP